MDDVITEMQDTVTNTTLDMLVSTGLAERMLSHFLKSEKLDFEISGFYMLFICKFLNCETKPAGFDQNLQLYIRKAFSMLLNRTFI